MQTSDLYRNWSKKVGDKARKREKPGAQGLCLKSVMLVTLSGFPLLRNAPTVWPLEKGRGAAKEYGSNLGAVQSCVNVQDVPWLYSLCLTHPCTHPCHSCWAECLSLYIRVALYLLHPANYSDWKIWTILVRFKISRCVNYSPSVSVSRGGVGGAGRNRMWK